MKVGVILSKSDDSPNRGHPIWPILINRGLFMWGQPYLALLQRGADAAVLELRLADPVDRQGVRDAQGVEALLLAHPALEHLAREW